MQKLAKLDLPDLDQALLFDDKPVPTGEPLHVSIELLDEDPNNPRTDFPDVEIDDLAEDIRRHGVLQPIVVCPVDAAGRYRIRFGAKRLRASKRAGLAVVPVVVLNGDLDGYAQVAENQKRQGLSPLDLARFIQGRVDAGESNAAIAQRMGIDRLTVTHHLALLTLGEPLRELMQSGRCTSPKTLYELAKLHERSPEPVLRLLTSDADITRAAVSVLRDEVDAAAEPSPTTACSAPAKRSASLDATRLCKGIARVLDGLKASPRPEHAQALAELRRELQRLASR
jgi:ParB family chromosome partitioning protein